jgi:peptide/nickel transport system substrate-binding protein
MFSISYAADSNWNDTHWKNERFNKLLKTARAELNDAKRREMYVEMQCIASDDSGNIIPMFADIVDAASTKLKFGPIGAQFELDSSRNTERWWFA